MHPTRDSSDQETTNDPTSEYGELARGLLGAGVAWARYGLTVARSSLHASARSLDATASLLETISDRIEQDKRH